MTVGSRMQPTGHWPMGHHHRVTENLLVSLWHPTSLSKSQRPHNQGVPASAFTRRPRLNGGLPEWGPVAVWYSLYTMHCYSN